MKKLLIASLMLTLAGCGERQQTAEEAAVVRRRDGEQATELFKEMTRFANEQTTVVCISGTQYMAWMDIGSTVRVHHYVALHMNGDTKYTRPCTGGPLRDLDNVPEAPRKDVAAPAVSLK